MHISTSLKASPEARHHRARIAALTRDRLPNDPELLDARRKFEAAKREMAKAGRRDVKGGKR